MPSASRPDWSGRLERLHLACVGLGIDALLCSSPLSLRYLVGFAGSAGLLLTRPGAPPVLHVDGRYIASAREAITTGAMAAVEVELVEQRYDRAIGDLAERLELRAIGFESAHVTVATLASWAKVAPAADWRPTERLVERLRIIKDDTEQATLRRAGALLSGVARALPRMVAAGRKERAIARDIDDALMEAGFSAPAFTTIVASGPHSAHPHARPTDRELRAGDLVVLDFGGVLDGYCVDLTRMAVVGQPTADAFSLYAAVRDAHRAAVDAVRPGIPASAIDAAAREVLFARGFGEAFVHATGHGLGLEVHEDPRISRAGEGDSERIERGMVFTIEPGAYVSQRGGVRLEDDVLVTADGCEVLTDAPRDLLVV